jgi:nitrogen fixation/metabolism regulation signal transduction histidine kinase
VNAPKRRRLGFQRRITLLALATGGSGAAVALALLWLGDHSLKLKVSLTLLLLVGVGGFTAALVDRVVYPVRTVANMLGALREGDTSFRARQAGRDDALGEVLLEVNALAETLRQQRLGALEATHLLRRVMAEIDVAIFAFDGSQVLRLVNGAGERLLAQPAERLLGRTADSLGLAGCLAGESPRTIEFAFPGKVGRWELHRSRFRQAGLPHDLLVLADLSRALREEERQAWKRLIRVLGHEINNSLAPIKSIAASLRDLLRREPRPGSWTDDVEEGLSVISARSEALTRFMASYARLARLPEPRLAPLDVEAWVRRVVALETRLPVELAGGPQVRVQADGDQLDQLLINLLDNAVDAALETGGGVRVGWHRRSTHLELRVEDDGPGLTDTTNLFVPFFSTKPRGTGIGLVLSRQIAEAHGGSLTLTNRAGARGCEACLRLPL